MMPLQQQQHLPLFLLPTPEEQQSIIQTTVSDPLQQQSVHVRHKQQQLTLLLTPGRGGSGNQPVYTSTSRSGS